MDGPCLVLGPPTDHDNEHVVDVQQDPFFLIQSLGSTRWLQFQDCRAVKRACCRRRLARSKLTRANRHLYQLGILQNLCWRNSHN